MRRFGWVALALVFLMLATAPAALAENRIALLIGNKDYKPGVGALVNPLNDVRVMGEALRGFEVLKARSKRQARRHAHRYPARRSSPTRMLSDCMRASISSRSEL